METGLQLGFLLLHIESQMMDLTWSNKDPSFKAVSIFETVIVGAYSKTISMMRMVKITILASFHL